MPQFQLNYGSPEAQQQFNQLDAFTQGYIEAMFFTNTGTPDDEELENAEFSDLAPETLAEIAADCTAFQERAGHTTELAYDYAPAEYDATMAGRDFWYTRNGQGVGFWDRGLGYLGTVPDTICRVDFRECDLYRGDDGRLYLA